LKILFLDIETKPNVAHVWGLWKQNVSLNQLMESSEMMCYAALNEDGMHFKKEGDDRYLTHLWTLLDEADVVVHYNGAKFDIPTINKEFLLVGMSPPSTYRQVDLLNVVKRQFRFPSNKLAYVSEALGIGGKTPHEGHTLWVRCMAGDKSAWEDMEEYNKNDVVLLEKLYHTLMPWIPSHPNYGLYIEDATSPVCPNCGEEHLQKRGFAYTNLSKFQRYCCMDCGKWCRSRKNIADRENLTTTII
jgi:DNA polymerase elongation subunit (family B)